PTDGGILLAARAEAAAAAIADAFRPYRRGGIGGRAGAERDISMAQLYALVALADGGSYAAGAAAAGVSQPSLHRAVGELERVCGVALVERRGRGVALSPSGQRLVRAFRLAMTELQAGLDELAVLAGRDQGTIRVAAHPAAMVRLIPAAAARFLAEHPPVTIDVEPSGVADDSGRLREGRIDALIALDGDRLRTEGLAVEPLLQDPLFVVGRSAHPLAGAASPGLVRLAGFGWAMPPPGAGERDAWERMFLDGGLYPPAPGFTGWSTAALLALVGQSDLLTFASAAVIEQQPAGRLALIGEPQLRGRDLVLVTRSSWAPTPAQAAFLDELRACSREVLEF
ncbi:MAG TPA: LysR substrate-binding domain-containing protein, partial [Allosphingosinicella sp.]